LQSAFQSFSMGFPYFILHLGTALGVFVLAAVLYIRLTPHRELALIEDGNVAAGTSLGAALIGLAIPISVTLATGVSIADILVWGVAAFLLQLAIFQLTDLVLRKLSKRIADGEVATAILLAAIKISGSLLLGAALVG